MKKFISLLLVAALLCFLFVTNPTTEEFAAWYARQAEKSLSTESNVLNQVLVSFRGLLAETAHPDNYLCCSVFTYNGHRTLGVGLMFFPLDSLGEQFQDLRSTYAEWLDSHIN